MKGKTGLFNVYKAFWNPNEVERDMTDRHSLQVAAPAGLSLIVKLILVLIPLIMISWLLLLGTFKSGSPEAKRVKQHEVIIPPEPSR